MISAGGDKMRAYTIWEMISLQDNDALSSLLQQLTTDNISPGDVLNRRNSRKYSPLHEAIFHRNIVAAELLINAGADVNLKCHGTPPSQLCLTINELPNGISFGNACLKLLLQSGDISYDAKDDQGYTIFHMIAEYNNTEALSIIHEVLGETIIDYLEMKDRVGFYPIHRATSKDAVATLSKLLDLGASMTTVTSTFSTVAHIAVTSGATKCWKLFEYYEDFHSLLSKRDVYNRNVMDTAALYGYDVDMLPQELKLLEEGPSAITGIITDVTCMQHHTCIPSNATASTAPPENIHRLSVLLDKEDGVLHSGFLKETTTYVDDVREASIADVLRVHEWPYLRRVQAKCEDLDDDAENEDGIAYIDGDTTVSKQSFRAALKACGAVCHAVDLVMSGEAKNCFCPIRPPGHHAGPRGVVKGPGGGPDSHGFCLINNISVGTAYAMNRYREMIKKVAIVDFDVHHGNGTEETVRWLQPDIEEIEVSNDFFFSKLQAPRFKPWFGFNDYENVFFVSVHGYGPRESGMEYLMPRAAFYPGSGRTHIPPFPKSPTAVPSRGISSKNPIKQSSRGVQSKETSDSNRRSTDGPGGNSGPNGHYDEDDGDDVEVEEDQGDDDQDNGDDMDANDEDENEECKENSEGDDDEVNEEASGGDIDGDRPTSPGLSELSKVFTRATKSPLILDVGAMHVVKFQLAQCPDLVHTLFREEIFPRLDCFKPDIIMISAGFDAHKKDTINAGYISLVEEDFEWITTHLVRLANTHCHGRIVSALEGGYQLGGECCSAFARSVKAHVVALNAAGAATPPYIASDLEQEKAHERRLLDEIEERRIEKERERQLMYDAVVSASQEESGIVGDVAPATDEGGAIEPRKRKRSQVDYTALDKILREQNGEPSTT